MGDTSNANETADGNEKPAQGDADVVFPPFPEPTQDDFEEDISSEEREYYKTKFADLNLIKTLKLHCTACDRHLGCSARNENRMRVHPMLRTLICQTCLTFYNSGEFDKGEDGSELYCRWCGQGGQVYCCSDCPHVFCAKCVKRNLGTKKIKEIEELDDWKCFKCNPRCLWDLRATCWALLRFCDMKNQITYKTQDQELKEKYQISCVQDFSECCKRKSKVKENSGVIKRESSRAQKDSNTAKTTPTIQVKKFASINLEDNSKEKIEKKAQKRPASPKVIKTYSVKTPIPIAPNVYNKKIKIAPGTPIRITMEKKPMQTYTPRQRMKAPMVYNGFNAYSVTNDNINLSLESLTQGLDMSAVASISGNNNMVENDDVVCTPDFPMEPLCEVTEDPGDDDVECITPAPQLVSTARCPPLLSRSVNNLPDLSPGNIIQMTENDVTVNAATGGLKFRVDPQTLSSNKMYRLPDGRIFAINANPTMPGGYSATIVAVTDNVQSTPKVPPRGATYAAKLSAVVTAPSTQSSKTNTRIPRKNTRKNANSVLNSNKTSTPKILKPSKTTEKRSSRPCDLNVPVEWYRFNLIDAVDALDYSLSRLNQLKTQATTMFLRTRTVNEMRNLHKTLDRALATSANRFLEIKDNLNNEFKKYVDKKQNVVSDDEEDDDDVEILPDTNDDPIFIDENSEDSQISNREVDLTAQASSEHESSGKSLDKTVINDGCVDLDIDKPEKDEGQHLRDPLMIEDKNEEIRDGEKSPLNGVDNNDAEEDSQQPKTSETENNESVSNVEMTGDSNTNEVSESSDNTHIKTDHEEISIKENGSNVLDENTSEDKVTDKEDVQIKDEKISDLKKPEKAVNDDSSKITDNDSQISGEVKEDIETQENDLDDIEMNDTAMENNDRMMDDNEMSEKAIEELLKDDNESIDGSVDNHSIGASNEKI
ncbi:transcriptional regulator ATRX [Aricia agestis]|uniref:transcriptional regulator ATRX n=1 Tax=Aricia agestis TaxID=91739 RepID=UPI001C2077A0|nr:transcriptional regulator ATRX [Aricia agestis]